MSKPVLGGLPATIRPKAEPDQALRRDIEELKSLAVALAQAVISLDARLTSFENTAASEGDQNEHANGRS